MSPSAPRRSASSASSDIFAAEIFGSGDSSDSVAREWLQKYREDADLGLTDLINCIIQCIGCEQQVTQDDIRDEENIPNRVQDLENVYQEVRRRGYDARDCGN